MPRKACYDFSDVREVICYPKPNSEVCVEAIARLKDVGLECYVSFGATASGRYRVLGRGWSSNVFLALWGQRLVAVKLLRPDSRRKSMLWEGVVWSVASSYSIAPRLHILDRYFLVVDWVRGPRLRDYAPKTRLEAIFVVRRLLLKAYLLDKLKIRHGELARPGGQVLVDSSVYPPEPYIVDYDTATVSKHPGNFTQLLGGLFTISSISTILRLREKLHHLRDILKNYKRKQTISVVEEVIEYIEKDNL
ncbi:MAG TPA: hypothetical protein EYH08_04670 [Pyrodictium sp.]|nr:hypothetical protein [Pyrodictium sp.]